MASDLTINIKLEPFFQEFLTNYFPSKPDAVFAFPAQHDLSIKLGILLCIRPENEKIRMYENDNFEIALPYNDVKNIYSYNYLYRDQEEILIRHIKLFFKTVFHEEINTLRKQGFRKKETVNIFIRKYGLNPNWYDRLIKDYHRYIANAKKIKYPKKNQKNLVSC